MIRGPDSRGNTELGAEDKRSTGGAQGIIDDDDNEVDKRKGEADDTNDGKLIMEVMRRRADERMGVEEEQHRG